MTRILIIEDDENKLEQIRGVLLEARPAITSSFAKSYQSGLRALLAGTYDMVLLDMTLPTFDRGHQESGGRTRPFAGRELIEQLDRRGVTPPVIVVSGFEILGEGDNQKSLRELDKELRKKFGGMYKGYVYYNPAESQWRNRLVEFVEKNMGALK